jgi:hypothetical protein
MPVRTKKQLTLRQRIALVLSRFIKPIAMGLGALASISLLGAWQAAGTAISIRAIAIAGIATAFVSYWILEYSRRFFFAIDILEEASTKGETVVDTEYDSKVQAALKRKREQESVDDK